VRAEELQLSGTMSGSKLFQDEPSKQTRENLHGEKEVGPAGDPAFGLSRSDFVLWPIAEMAVPELAAGY
jgi:hypothetical protein